jgi:hypothetical protein
MKWEYNLKNQRMDIFTTALAINNIIGGVLHLIFEFYLLSDTSIFRGFLLIENFLIGMLFIYFGFGLLFLKIKQRIFLIQINIGFWLLFVIAFILFQPDITSLVVIERYLPMQQKNMLLMIGIITFCINLMSYREHLRLRCSNT